MVTVTKNPDSEVDLYEVLKAHSDQISRLTHMVESLQSQIKEIDQRPASGNNKTSSVGRKRSATKTKKNKAISKRAKRKSSKRK